jgi:hypothetical protein
MPLRYSSIKQDKDEPTKKHPPPISISLLSGGIFAALISHGISIATQHRKTYPSIGRCSCFLVNSITSDFEADIVRPIEEKQAFNDVQVHEPH